MGKNDEIHRSPDQSPGERVGSPRPVRPLLRVRRLPLGRGSADQRPRYLLRLQSGRLVQPVLLLMEQATEAQAEKAIAVLQRAIDRTSAVSGRSVAVWLGLGGRRFIKKTNIAPNHNIINDI